LPVIPGSQVENGLKEPSYNILNFNSIDLEC